MLEKPASERLHPMLRSYIGAVLEELLFVGSPCRISLGRTASCGRDPMLDQGRRVTMKEQWMQSIRDRLQPPLQLEYALHYRCRLIKLVFDVVSVPSPHCGGEHFPDLCILLFVSQLLHTLSALLCTMSLRYSFFIIFYYTYIFFFPHHLNTHDT